MFMRSVTALLRRSTVWITLSVIATPVLGQFFIQAATDNHWYDGAGARIAKLASLVVAIAGSKSGLAVAALLGGFTAGLHTEILLRKMDRRRLTEPAVAPEEFARSLYVGEMTVATGRLAGDHCLEIAVRVYNGARQAIRIASVEGFIEARIQPSADGKPVPASLKLPQPSLQRDRTDVECVGPGKECLISLQQLLPPSMASDIVRALDGAGVHLLTANLAIGAVSVDDHTLRGRISLWDGINLRRWNGDLSGRITTMTVSTVAFGHASVA